MKKIALTILLLGSLAFATVCVIKILNNETVYVNTQKLYTEFKLTRELDSEMQNILRTRKHISDSLYRDLMGENERLKNQKAISKNDLEKLSYMEENYNVRLRQFEEDNQNITAQFNQKIWTQINQYIEDFGIQEGYSYILGSTAEGNIMYSNEKNDITDAVVKYINDKYDGKTN